MCVTHGVWGIRIMIYKFYVLLGPAFTPSLHQSPVKHQQSHIILIPPKDVLLHLWIDGRSRARRVSIKRLSFMILTLGVVLK